MRVNLNPQGYPPLARLPFSVWDVLVSKKILIIGGVAAGATAAARARRLDEDADITVIECGPCVSDANLSVTDGNTHLSVPLNGQVSF
jgi:hypothetical protein